LLTFLFSVCALLLCSDLCAIVLGTPSGSIVLVATADNHLWMLTDPTSAPAGSIQPVAVTWPGSEASPLDSVTAMYTDPGSGVLYILNYGTGATPAAVLLVVFTDATLTSVQSVTTLLSSNDAGSLISNVSHTCQPSRGTIYCKRQAQDFVCLCVCCFASLWVYGWTATATYGSATVAPQPTTQACWCHRVSEACSSSLCG